MRSETYFRTCLSSQMQCVKSFSYNKFLLIRLTISFKHNNDDDQYPGWCSCEMMNRRKSLDCYSQGGPLPEVLTISVADVFQNKRS